LKKKNKRLKQSEYYSIVLNILVNKANKPFNYKQIAKEIADLPPKDVLQVLELLSRDGKIEKVDRSRYMYVKTRDEVIGTLDFNQRGDAYLVADNLEDDIKIKSGNTLDAFHGDEVAVKVIYGKKSGRTKAFVTRIIQRATTTFVGEVSQAGNAYFVLPDSSKIHTDFYVPKEYLNGAKHGDKVLIKLRDWPASAKNPYASVKQVFGKVGENDAEMHAIVAEFGFDTHFPARVEDAASKLTAELSKEELKKRQDYRGVTTFTIDPHDAKDFDDALSFQDFEDGSFEIGVHIADVSHYVQPGDIIDAEAVKRATSVYLVDRTIPMLPERLSNELCSLRPNEDSLCFAVIFKLNANGKVLKYEFVKTIIHSQQRFAYEEAQEVIEGKAHRYASALSTMNSIAHKLRQQRFNNGAINFETTEFKFDLDETGKPVAVFPKVRKDAHKMIEEYMLLANKYVAMHLYTKNNKTPLPYRVHEEPSPEKLKEFAETAKNFGFSIQTENYKVLSKSINEMVQKVEGTIEGDILQPLAIRSMEKAYYTSKKVGHFGLAFDYYAHFTSPIRRYPDLITHRMLYDYLTKSKSFNYNEVEKLAKHCSEQEQKAVSAERASTKYKQVEYLSNFTNEEFEGIISGVTDWGIYVEIIENKCEGMVRIRDIKGDHYSFYPEKKKVIGQRTKNSYGLGQRVWIKVKRTDINKRTIDFELIAQ
jgi:ribonuclease R